MYQDILDLMHFYNSPLGQFARRNLRGHLRQTWPNVHGERILGLGYTTPYLRPFMDQAERVIGVMPASQGVTPWPDDARNVIALSDETNLPFQDYSMDRVIVVHGLEGCGDPHLLLQEIWRVLVGHGQLLLVVPNRLGLWARFDNNPFGHGQPFSASQVAHLLRQELFTPLTVRRALYVPPVQSRFWLSGQKWFEKIGGTIFPQFSGVTIIEAKKEVYAAHPLRYRRKAAYSIFPGQQAPVTPPQV